MLRIKRLDRFMLQSFLPLFLMTFFICLFIVLMQFLWRYIDDLVGKGLGVDVIAELFFYAALTMIPMALPLAILLASLMTFGNLGEQFELTAMKASGVSLIRAMGPLTVLMILIATGAFFFQNNVLPVAQTKMWTLLYSMRQKSPELEIPEGVFYDQIPGFNLFVQSKDRESGMLRDMMIYDMSQGFDNARIILADSGKLAFSEDQTHLYLRLWEGELFENLKQAGPESKSVPYRRESFKNKEIIIKFDANFNRMDEQGMRNQYVGKNIAELRATIDSVNLRVDSIGRNYGNEIMSRDYVGVTQMKSVTHNGKIVRQRNPEIKMDRPVNIDSAFNGSTSGVAVNVLNQALVIAKRNQQDFEYKAFSMADDFKTIRRHGIELQKKFTLSFACIIFFFIGAPLGAIIRKGGLGMPLVISVFLFIFYYIIDNTGYKLARDGRLPVWEGMWLSAAVLLPLGIFLTYKAVNDSAVFNKDAYRNFFHRLIGRREKRNVAMKEFTMDELTPQLALERIAATEHECASLLSDNKPRQNYVEYWTSGYNRSEIKNVISDVNTLVNYLSGFKDRKLIHMLNEVPVIPNLLLYHPTNYKWVAWTLIVCFPVGLPLYIAGRYHQSRLRKDVTETIDVLKKLRHYFENAGQINNDRQQQLQ